MDTTQQMNCVTAWSDINIFDSRVTVEIPGFGMKRTVLVNTTILGETEIRMIVKHKNGNIVFDQTFSPSNPVDPSDSPHLMLGVFLFQLIYAQMWELQRMLPVDQYMTLKSMGGTFEMESNPAISLNEEATHILFRLLA